MSTQTFLVIGATGKTGQYTVQHLLERGHAVRAMALRHGRYTAEAIANGGSSSPCCAT
jgi:NAD(P)H dehydrogenase (quinone)